MPIATTKRAEPEVDVEDARLRAYRITARTLHAHLHPPPQLTVSEWADEHRILPDTSAEPGRWKTSRAPYLRKIMDACSDPMLELVVVKKGAQVGYSECLLNVLGYFIHQDPAPVLLVQISTKEAEKFSKERVAPLIESSPVLRAKVDPPKSRDSGNTIDSKDFEGGHLGIVGANAPSGLRSRARRVVLFDEIDGYPPSAGDEGDPIAIAVKRTTTFWNRLVVKGSTPTIADFSRIEDALEDCDVVYRYHVPCPDCGELQPLEFENVRWEKDEEAEGQARHLTHTAAYACAACGVLIPERKKAGMLAAGDWVVDELRREPITSVGFDRLSALYSPWFTWAELAKEFIQEKDNPLRLQVFVNTRLGEVYDEKGNTLNEDPLLARREDYPAQPLPSPVVLLTAGFDVQADRIEGEILGWGVGEQTWSIDFLRITGDPSVDTIWGELLKVLQQRYEHPSGVRLPIAATAIDSRFQTQQVLKFAADKVDMRVWAVHGVDGMGKPIMGRPQLKTRRKVPRYPVGVDTAKGVVYSRLRIEEPGDGYCHFPQRPPYDEEHFRQLTSEKMVVRSTKLGHLKRMWVRRPNRRAEVLDCRVYATAAFEGLVAAGLRLEQLAEDLKPTKKAAPAPRVRVLSKGQYGRKG